MRTPLFDLASKRIMSFSCDRQIMMQNNESKHEPVHGWFKTLNAPIFRPKHCMPPFFRPPKLLWFVYDWEDLFCRIQSHLLDSFAKAQ